MAYNSAPLVQFTPEEMGKLTEQGSLDGLIAEYEASKKLGTPQEMVLYDYEGKLYGRYLADPAAPFTDAFVAGAMAASMGNSDMLVGFGKARFRLVMTENGSYLPRDNATWVAQEPGMDWVARFGITDPAQYEAKKAEVKEQMRAMGAPHKCIFVKASHVDMAGPSGQPPIPLGDNGYVGWLFTEPNFITGLASVLRTLDVAWKDRVLGSDLSGLAVFDVNGDYKTEFSE